MSTPFVCPHCRGKLRLRPTAAPRIRCRLCGKGFDNPTGVVVPAAELWRPLGLADEGDAPPPAGGQPAPVAHVALAPPAPVVTDIDDPTGPTKPFEPDPILTIPRVPGSTRRALARARLRARFLSRFKLHDYLVAAGILLCGLALVGGVGYVLVREALPERARTTPPDGDAPPNEVAVAAPVPSLPAGEPTIRRPQRLVGVWELRADEDRAGHMEFRADGEAVVQASVGGVSLPADRMPWSVTQEDGDDLTVEMGRPGAPGNMRLYLTLTSPDALTLVGTTVGGIDDRDARRFVRRADNEVRLPPHPVVP
jgi:hypothetical protein